MKAKFSGEWFTEFCRKINEDEKYRKDGKGWKWSITFSIIGDKDSYNVKAGMKMVVKMVLKDGRCNGIEIKDSEDITLDEYLISGRASTWENLMEGKTSLINSMLKGDLKVTGDIARLSRYVLAAEDLARIASGVV